MVESSGTGTGVLVAIFMSPTVGDLQRGMSKRFVTVQAVYAKHCCNNLRLLHLKIASRAIKVGAVNFIFL